MYTLDYVINIGNYRLAMLDKVEIHRSVELLADTATITLPGSQYNQALGIEQYIHRGDKVSVLLGYKETGLIEEFAGYVQRISTDGGSITLTCEDELYALRKPLKNAVHKHITLSKLLALVLQEIGGGYQLSCSYTWTYDKFVIHAATVLDVLKKIQEESGADIYLKGKTLHIHPPGEVVGTERYYDFALNIESANLTYRKAEDKKIQVVVKSTLPDGKVKEITIGATGGDKVEVKCATTDDQSMRARAKAEILRRSFDGYDGTITTWLIPSCSPSDTVMIRDRDYPNKEGTYFVRSVKTHFGADGGKREIELGFRLS